ncbi:MAG: LrgB family protein [Clostridia bacterium]|nr:LrgB family protein [Clostridia bacterium]MBQ3091224.1 LrgB family protein [Clostridia bacterium]
MNNMISISSFFGVALSLFAYMIGLALQKKFKKGIFNPLLISILLVIAALLITGIDYRSYNVSASYLGYLLTPTTICLAIPLYRRLDQLKKNFWAIIGGITAGAVTSMGSVFLLCLAFGLDHTMYATLLPKSITTAIGMGISEEFGGVVTITVAVIILTGVLGNIICQAVCKLAGITDPVAKGIAIGSSSHAIGTTKAMEIGETEGAMSSLSIAVSGIITVLLASFFAGLI